MIMWYIKWLLKQLLSNDDIEEEIYMNQPKGFLVREGWIRVVGLRILYGLKQAPELAMVWKAKYHPLRMRFCGKYL